MALDAGSQGEGVGDFDPRMEGFEIVGVADAIGDGCVGSLEAGEESQVVPDDEATRIDEGGDLDAVVVLVLDDVAPGFGGEDAWRGSDMATGAGIEVEFLSQLQGFGDGIYGGDTGRFDRPGELPGDDDTPKQEQEKQDEGRSLSLPSEDFCSNKL